MAEANQEVDDRLDDLLAEWVEQREQGREVSLDVLCRDDPSLAAPLSTLVARLKQTEWLFEDRIPSQRKHDENGVWDPSAADAFDAPALLERIAQLGILSAGEAAAWKQRFTGARGGAVARALVEQDVATRYQLKDICENGGQELLLDDYLLLDLIGEGGMGRVYRARHRTMDRVVALKVIHPRALRLSGAVPRFRQEMAAVARLDHPQIVRSYDAGESGGRHYLVMECVVGTDLATLVDRQGPLPVEQATECVLQAARALQYAHGEGVIHRDVKPSNLLLDQNGGLKVLDLGLARVAGAVADQRQTVASNLTGSSQVMGTIDYLAPEQARDSRHADARSDVYSLGCTLYALLHGQPMYDDPSLVSRLLAHQTAPIPSLRTGRPEISRQLEEVFRRMVAKRPEQRFQSMNEVVAALSGTAGARRRVWMCRPAAAWQRSSLAGAALLAALAIAPISPWSRSGETADRVTTSSFAAARGGLSPTPRPSPTIGRLPTPISDSPGPPTAVAPFDHEAARLHQQRWAEHLGVPVVFRNSLGMTFRLIPPGEFAMGTPREEAEAHAEAAPRVWADEHRMEFPVRRVRLTKAFYLAVCEVTQHQYQTVFGDNPSHFAESGRGSATVQDIDTGRHPVENVSWVDAAGFCNRLAGREGLPDYYLVRDGLIRINEREPIGYRLPTEAEWEFACRSGCEGPFGFPGPESLLPQYSYYFTNADRRTHDVASRQPNAFGLHDMHGNVWEWCFDCWGAYDRLPTIDPCGPAIGTVRTRRGGSWDNPAVRCRSAIRCAQSIDHGSSYTGFRVALSVDAVRNR